MTKVQLPTSAATPDPRDQHEPTALYRLYAAAETLLYIGVTDTPDRRFKQHRDSKPWWPLVAEKTIEWHPTRRAALAAEAAAVEAETPVHNIDHNPAAPSYRWPPTGMPADRVDGIERAISTLPASDAEGIRRAAFEGQMRAQLDATIAFQALAAEYRLQVVEWDTSTLGENLRDKFYAHYLQLNDGRRLLVVPADQDPAQRLWAVRNLLAHRAVTA